MAETVEQQQQNVVVRLINLPFVSSTYEMVSSVYVTTKDSHPYLKTVCDVAEASVKSITSVAITSAMPILNKLEPQIALANNIACIGLDKIEEKLPILYQPSEKVVANASEAVVGARDAVVHGITGVVNKTKGAVQDSVEMTKAVVNGSINTVLGSRVVKIMSNRVDTALTRSESLLEQCLYPTDDELRAAKGSESQEKPGYYVRLGSLSTKIRKRGYRAALLRLKYMKYRSRQAIVQLHNTVNLIEYARKNMNNANQKICDAQEKMYNKWVEWTKDASGETEGAEEIESRTLTIAQNLTNRLKTPCLYLLSSIQGLQQNLQNKVHSVNAMATDVYQNVQSATKDKLTIIKDCMDEMMDYCINNTPLNWLSGHFTPEQAGSQPEEEKVDGNSVKEE